MMAADSPGPRRSTRVAVADGVMEITFARPDQQNRVDDELVAEFLDALTSLRDQPEVRAGILAADGPIFSAGGDFDFIARMHDEGALRERNVRRARRTVDVILAV